jgi:hypothetical protein
MSVQRFRGSRSAAIGFASLALLGLPAGFVPSQPAQAGPAKEAPLEIAGKYAIYFNGFDIGTVRIDQRTTGRAYTASSHVEISALLGAFRWKGVTRSAGVLSAGALEPSGYDFQYEGTSKSGSVRMGFTKGTVTSLTAIPETIEPADLVPLKQAHVKSVLDPLSAIVAVSRPAADPCGRKMAVFDGKQRFDIALIPARREAVPSGRNSAEVEGLVCRVKYTPVAGYRDNGDTRALAESNGIEVTFRPIREAGLWSPYRVTIPTMAGTVTLEATRFDVSAPGLAEIALVD